MGGRLFGGGSLGRINKQAIRSAKVIMPALASVVGLNPSPEENRLFIMIGWTTAPTADPAEAKVIAKVRFFLKYSESTATLGTYIMPAANPIPIPCVRKICSAKFIRVLIRVKNKSNLLDIDYQVWQKIAWRAKTTLTLNPRRADGSCIFLALAGLFLKRWNLNLQVSLVMQYTYIDSARAYQKSVDTTNPSNF